MEFESLANEILLILFEYLDVINLFRAFYYLNNRFNQLLIKLHKYHLDFRSISKDDFNHFYQQHYYLINNRISSLHLPDEVETQNFFSDGYPIDQFTHIKLLSISYIYSFNLINQITTQCQTLSFLTHINITISSSEDPENFSSTLSDNIWSLPSLTHCYLNIEYRYPVGLMRMSVTSQSITYLCIKNMSYDIDSLVHLFKHTPRLQRLYIGRFHIYNGPEITTNFPSLISLNIIIDSSILSMKYLFEKLPNLCYLTLELDKIYLNGYQWEDILTKYFKTIKLFRFKMTIEFSLSEDLEDQVDQILDSFRSDYWIKKHQWFVQCDWHTLDYNTNGLLYSLPYAFDSFNYIEGHQSKSTSFNELNYSIYNRVQIFHYTTRKRNFNENQISSPIQFLNIRHIQIKIPCNDEFLSVLPRLDQLVSLNVILNHNLGYSQLQIILDRAINLYSLSFLPINKFSMSSFNINSQSIRRLEFLQPISYYSQYFTKEEYTILARSSIVSQCNTLIINVENQEEILDLIQTIPKLQVLSIQCNQQESNDNLILWLQEHSSFTYTYAIQRKYHGSARFILWIHKTAIVSE